MERFGLFREGNGEPGLPTDMARNIFRAFFERTLRLWNAQRAAILRDILLHKAKAGKSSAKVPKVSNEIVEDKQPGFKPSPKAIARVEAKVQDPDSSTVVPASSASTCHKRTAGRPPPGAPKAPKAMRGGE